jgi:phage repressor protein C with HTH and peptisase S24 domain
MNESQLEAFRVKRLADAIAKVSGGNQTDFGRKLGYVDGAFVRQMLRGTRKVKEDTIRKIESLPGMRGWFDPKQVSGTTSHFRGGVAEPAPLYAVPKSLQSDARIPALKSLPDDVDIPLSSAIASMGRGVDQAHEEVVTHMTVNRAWLARNCTYTSLENLTLLTGHGDSMTGIYEDGDVLLVDRGIREIKIDGIYALARNDELFIKRVARRVDGSFLMLSNNPSYPPEPITDVEREKFSILGRVVMVWNARRM